MKSIALFKKFMHANVDLNKTRINRLNRHVGAVQNFLDRSSFQVKGVYPQGSYAHQTIIKPAKKNKEFDVDIVIRVNEERGWEARDYIENLYALFKENPVYRTKVGRKSRCITLDYTGEFHLDIVPLLRTDMFNGLFGKKYQILNRNTNEYERTDSFGYTNWLMAKNLIIPKDYFVMSIRLLKYLRDSKQNFSAKSVLLNTVLGDLISESEDISSDFCDFPTSFRTILNRLNEWLQGNPMMPIVMNPCLETENFNRHWNEIKYQNFKSKVEYYAEWVNDAYSERNRKLSTLKWQRVLGSNFGI